MIRSLFIALGAAICGFLGSLGGLYLGFELTTGFEGLNLVMALAGVGAILGTLLGGGLGSWVGRGMQTLLRKNGFKIAE